MIRFNEKIVSRINNEIEFFLTNPSPTLRSCAVAIRMSKSTVHLDLTKRFKFYLDNCYANELASYPNITNSTYLIIQDILKTNLKERSSRGGMSTRNKYIVKKLIDGIKGVS